MLFLIWRARSTFTELVILKLQQFRNTYFQDFPPSFHRSPFGWLQLLVSRRRLRLPSPPYDWSPATSPPPQSCLPLLSSLFQSNGDKGADSRGGGGRNDERGREGGRNGLPGWRTDGAGATDGGRWRRWRRRTEGGREGGRWKTCEELKPRKQNILR